MQDQPRRRPPTEPSHVQGVRDPAGLHVRLHAPANDLSTVQIENRRRMEPTPCCLDVGDHRGRKTRTTQAKDRRRCIPQGSPISPLLANLYTRRVVFVILCSKGKADEALLRLREIMGKLKLTFNEEKTRICKTLPTPALSASVTQATRPEPKPETFNPRVRRSGPPRQAHFEFLFPQTTSPSGPVGLAVSLSGPKPSAVAPRSQPGAGRGRRAWTAMCTSIAR